MSLISFFKVSIPLHLYTAMTEERDRLRRELAEARCGYSLLANNLNLLSERLEETKRELAEAREFGDKWRLMLQPYIGGYEKGPNPSYLCLHRYRLADCITCLNEHITAECGIKERKP